MLRLAKIHDRLSIVDNQFGRPTYTLDLATAALKTLSELRQSPEKAGVYHVSNSGEPISWAQFAQVIFKAAKLNVLVNPISASEYPTTAARPAYSCLLYTSPSPRDRTRSRMPSSA